MKSKYRYYVKIQKPFIFKNNIYFEKTFNVTEDENYYYFYVYNYNHRLIDSLDDDSKEKLNIQIIDLKNNAFKQIINKYFITILGLLLFVSMLFILNRNITEIKFINEEYYDIEVYQYVYDYLNGDKYKFINKKTINEINEEIRSVFYKYQWISVVKKGTIIYIDIAKTDDDKTVVDDNTPGGLYSNYDAIIKGYAIEKGVSLIKKDISVSIGDELISGVLPLYDNKFEYIHAKGYVIGEVNEYITKEIDKRVENLVRTGRFTKVRKYAFFDKGSNKEYDQYDNYEVEYKSIFKLGKIFEVLDVYIYELKEDVREYTLEDAYEYTKSLIIDDFNANREFPSEKIISMQLINGYLKDNVYYVTYFVSIEKNISYFEPYDSLDN